MQASYARFLWDVEEDEDEVDGEEEQRSDEIGIMPSTTTFRDFSQLSAISTQS